ncbi:MAG: PQ-loop domain-containing transporter [Acidimicrobiales bacterium]|jgi:uncharacterized protein with PQ loop repeat
MIATAVTAAGVLGISSPALTIGRAAPQAVRIIRSGAAGVSVWTWIQAIFLAEVWGAYGFLFHVQAEVVTNIPGGVLALLVVILVGYRTGATAKVLALTSACSLAAAALIIASVAYGVPRVVSLVAVVGALGLYVPQLVKLFRSPEIAGVSLASWQLALLGTISWIAYGIVVHKLPVVLPNVVMLPSSLAIVWRVGVLRRRERLGDDGGCASRLVA